MTRPAERTLATLRTLDFLFELSTRQDVPDDVRDTAHYLARHFPRACDIEITAKLMAHSTNSFGIVKFCVDDEHMSEALKEAFEKARKYDSR